jgi:hypothetical protein
MPNPAYVQGNKVSNGSGTTSSVSITLTGVATGNSLQLDIGCFRGAGIPAVQSVTDNLGNVWKPVTIGYGGANRSWGQVWAAVNVAAGSTTVTVNFGSATTVQYVYLELHEISNAPIVGCSNGQASASSGTDLSTPNLSMPGANELFIEFGYVHAASAVITPGSGYTAAQSGGTSPLLGASASQLIATQAATSAVMTSSVSADWVCIAVGWSNALGTITNGQVVLGTNGGAGSIIGTAGGGNDPNGNATTKALVFDAGSQTQAIPTAGGSWTQWLNPNASGDYVGIDCGAPIQADHVLLSFINPVNYTNLVTPNTAQIQASNDPTFASFQTIFPINATATLPAAAPQWGTLHNNLTFPQLSGYYRYYRITLPAASSAPADLEFYGSYYSGVAATCAPVSITNTNGTTGGYYDLPVQVSMATPTTGAAIWYTTDGSTPSAGGGTSQQYTGPIVISSNKVIQAIAVLSGLSNSRVTLASYHITSIVPTDIPYSLNRGGYRIWTIAGDKFLDPVSGLWYWYGQNVDQNGVVEAKGAGVDCYSSIDLRNWNYVSNCSNIAQSAPPVNRVSVVYNVANNNYVMWTQQGLSNNSSVFTAPAPGGPWTLFASYTVLDGYNTQGDFKLFLDTDGSCYLIICDNAGGTPNNTTFYIVIHKLNSTYTNTSGSFVAYNNQSDGTNTTPFGRQSEGFAMFKIGSTYYWQSSNLSPWPPGLNLYVTNTTGPLGTWSAPSNPFQPDANELTDGAAGNWSSGSHPFTPSQNFAFDSQTDGFYIIPGRQGINAGTPALIYVGDRWDFSVFPPSIQTTNDSFKGWRHIMLPVAVDPNSGALSISWTNNWTFDSVFPPLTGQPAAPSGLGVAVGVNVSWTNNETKPHGLYLDRATDGAFTQNVLSVVLTQGTTSYTDTSATPATTQYFYRVRAVNASGSSVTPGVAIGLAPTSGPGPYDGHILAQDPDTLMRPPIPTFSINQTVEPLPTETQAQYNSRVGAAVDNVSTVGPYGTFLPAKDPLTLMRPPVPIPAAAPGHESDLVWDIRTGRKPLPGETQDQYNARVGTISPRQ